jgi:predicted esterase
MSIFIGHGTADTTVAFQHGQKSVEYLTSDCCLKKATEEDVVGVTFKSYDSMGHESNSQELRDIATFLRKVIPSTPE